MLTPLICVDNNKLWKIIKEMEISDHLTCLLRNMYAGQEAIVRTGKEAGWESGDPGPPSSTCESSQDSSEHTYFSGRHSPAPRLLLTPLRANGPRDIAKFTHLDGRPLGRSEFLASVPRFSLPHSSTLLNWYLSFFRRKHTRIQRFLKSVVFFCFNTTNSELLRTLPLSQMFSSCVLGGGLQVELGLQVTGAWQSVVHNDLKIRFHWS